MDVQDQIGIFVQAQSHTVGLGFRHGARLPEKEVAIGIKGFRFDFELHAGETGTWLFFLAARRLAAVHKNVRVMNHAFVAGPDLDGFQPARAVNRSPKNEIPVHIGASGGKRVRFLRFDNFVRLAQLPTGDKSWGRQKVGGSALDRPLLDPLLNDGYLSV